MSRIIIINKDIINKDVNINISKFRRLLFRISIIKFKVTTLLFSYGIRIGRTIVIRVAKSVRVL